MMTPEARSAIDAIRGFNRFYTRQMGLLERGLLGSRFTLTEARVLYELASRDVSTASEIARELALDFGYLSRLLKKFERRAYIERTRSSADARQSWLQLTSKGRAEFNPLQRASRKLVGRMIDPLTPGQRLELLGAMQTMQRLLQPPPLPSAPYSVRALKVGDVGWIIHRQALLYAQEYGWDETYEGLAAEIMGNFLNSFDPRFERAWVAEQDHIVVGSVFLVRASARVARLRLLYVEPSARGLGIGTHLVKECVEFARASDYKTVTLWTNDVLVAARRIYEAAGFELVKEQRHRSFGKDLVGQTWELAL
jgi:DNA-binding MarR family transcriptional regulator/GNAT superfamily N-acetyltransferase